MMTGEVVLVQSDCVPNRETPLSDEACRALHAAYQLLLSASCDEPGGSHDEEEPSAG